MNVIDIPALQECSEWLFQEGKVVWGDEVNKIITRIKRQRKSKLRYTEKARKERRSKGICREGGCEHKVEFPHTRCNQHIMRHNVKAKVRRDILTERGYCPRCTMPLLAGMDDGYITCLNCRQKDLRTR